ncbi:MAG: haloalkane dehalogenase, partial [Sphingomonas sp.]|nr:haloalkane dehalogenase [Sphingomonas sp.]
DKPVRQEDYSFDFHRNYLLALVERLDLRHITLVVQDWGGVLGLTLPLEPGFAARLDRLIVMNTAISTGAPAGDAFMMWRNFAAKTPDLPVGALIATGTPHLTPAEIAAYDAPYPDARYKAGAQIFPALAPIEPDMPGAALGRAARDWWSTQWDGPSFMAVGDADPVLGPPQMAVLRGYIRGCPEPMMVAGGGHFVQEWGEPIARAALAAFGGR